MYIFLKRYILKVLYIHSTMNIQILDQTKNLCKFLFSLIFCGTWKRSLCFYAWTFSILAKNWHLYHNLFSSVKGKPKKLSSTLHTDGKVKKRSHFFILKVPFKHSRYITIYFREIFMIPVEHACIPS